MADSAEVDSVVSRLDEEEDEKKNKKQKILEKRNEMLEEWEFPQIIGRIQKCEDLILEFINVKFEISLIIDFLIVRV